MGITDAEQKREKRLKTNEESLRELWDNIKHTNIRIIGVPEGEEREKGTEKIFKETIAWSSCRGTVVTNPTRNHEVVGSIPVLAQWVKDLVLP